VYANHTHITRESAVMASDYLVAWIVEFSVILARGYHIYEDTWDATVGEE